MAVKYKVDTDYYLYLVENWTYFTEKYSPHQGNNRKSGHFCPNFRKFQNFQRD